MKKTSRRGFGKQLGWALGALPVLALAPKTVEGKRRRKLDGDTPITVGGGGGSRSPKRLTPPFSEIRLERNDYILDGDTYKNEFIELDYVMVGRRNHWTRYEANANTRVEIEYRRGVTHPRIIINQDGTMGVTFTQNQFPYEILNKRHYGRDLELSKLWVGGVEKPLPTNGNFEIVAHTRLKDRKRRSS